ncbi:hypothetical protein DTL21_24030 [Bremerella cremea]|uniref:Uncharacterized protein n=1 Tax=Blastopirellula marina TaxID=124 RepID=A0A2S8FE37_9BACT|nr:MULTISPECIES: hypothetical protein [Pirellulaceae]PQO30426.1 hypothetical protein C5Y83_23985 [Blastopirellula marina]RCS43779.1 hypothetical protein DTL21_24030 [Bremerella cremea]
MKTFHEWLRERQQQEGLLLNADGRLKGMSPANPLPRDSAVNKSLSKKPKSPPLGVPPDKRQHCKPWKPAQPAKLQPFNPAQPAKIVMQKPKAGH